MVGHAAPSERHLSSARLSSLCERDLIGEEKTQVTRDRSWITLDFILLIFYKRISHTVLDYVVSYCFEFKQDTDTFRNWYYYSYNDGGDFKSFMPAVVLQYVLLKGVQISITDLVTVSLLLTSPYRGLQAVILNFNKTFRQSGK